VKKIKKILVYFFESKMTEGKVNELSLRGGHLTDEANSSHKIIKAGAGVELLPQTSRETVLHWELTLNPSLKKRGTKKPFSS